MRCVILESPYRGMANSEAIAANVAYARRCVRDCVDRGESPNASHLLFTQPGILNDDDPTERALGIAAGRAWLTRADAMVVYTDRGVSSGMEDAIRHAESEGVRIEYRSLAGVEA